MLDNSTLAKTPTRLVEWEDGLFTITREDGRCLGLQEGRPHKVFAGLLTTEGTVNKAIAAMEERMLNAGLEWEPLYKASAMPRLLAQPTHERTEHHV